MMNNDVSARIEFVNDAMQVRAFWSNVHKGFYVVTAFGFPCFIYVEQLNRWFGSENEMVSAHVQRKFSPLESEVTVVSPDVLSDIYRRGVAGLVKHRILGKVK